jgi:hypothetical protein
MSDVRIQRIERTPFFVPFRPVVKQAMQSGGSGDPHVHARRSLGA